MKVKLEVKYRLVKAMLEHDGLFDPIMIMRESDRAMHDWHEVSDYLEVLVRKGSLDRVDQNGFDGHTRYRVNEYTYTLFELIEQSTGVV